MANNCGATSLKRRRRNRAAMHDFDRLPEHLRQWVTQADLPWRARSVQVAYDKALKRTGSHDQALAELDRIQEKLIRKDVARVWGHEHPAAQQQMDARSA